MKTFTLLVCCVLLAFSTGGPSTAADASRIPQNGIMNSKNRRERIQQALHDRNKENLQVDANLREGRRARQSCIADFQKLCNSEALFAASSSSVATLLATSTEDLNADAHYSKNKQKKNSKRRQYNLFGMENCLSEKFLQIEHPRCRLYVEGRLLCFKEADSVCREQVEAAPTATDDNKRGAEGSSSVNLLGIRSGSAATSARADLQVKLERARLLCLRREPMSRFSVGCTNSSYFKSIYLMNREGGSSASKKMQAPTMP